MKKVAQCQILEYDLEGALTVLTEMQFLALERGGESVSAINFQYIYLTCFTWALGHTIGQTSHNPEACWNAGNWELWEAL